ncbi:MAG: PAS domain S-box protein, partial [Candidatus Manganitrophaceae bacterium]
MTTSQPKNIASRRSPLHGSVIQSLLSEESFDDVPRLAAHLCDAPIAFIHFIENDQHTIQSAVGLESQAAFPDLPFFSHAILQPDVFVVPDASTDERFKAGPRFLSGGQIRFFAGAPLITAQGQVIGTLSVMSFSSKVLNSDQIRSLQILARQITRRVDLWVELRRGAMDYKRFEERLAAEHGITDVLAQSKTLSTAVQKILKIFCETLGWTMGFFWQANDQVAVLTCVESGRGLSETVSEFEAIRREKILWPDEELPGRVLTRGAPAWINHPGDGDLFEQASLAAGEGLHGAFALPILGQDRILGVMEFFSEERMAPDDHLLEMMSNVGNQIGQFMERTRAEERLIHLGALVESSDDAIIGKTVEGLVTSWNTGAQNLFGYLPEEMIGRSISILFPPDRIGELSMILEKLKRGERITSYETVRIKKGGERIHVSLTISPIRDQSGRIVGASSIKRNITERKKMEKVLRESEARKAAILESSLDCIMIIDHQGKILEFNPAAESTFGYLRREVLGKEMAELMIPPSLREQHRAGMAHYLENRESAVLYRRIEMTAMRSDRSEFPAELTMIPIHLEGPPIFTCYLRDISERQRTEEERNRFLIQERISRTEAEEAQQRMSFLAEASTLLASSLDYETTLASVARLAVPYLADGCVVDILEENQTVRRLA